MRSPRKKPHTITEALYGWVDEELEREGIPSARKMMSCGHRANAVTHDTLMPLCDICMNVEQAVA